jgi:hypothetical protein
MEGYVEGYRSAEQLGLAEQLADGGLDGLADGEADGVADGVGDGFVEGLGQPVQDPVQTVDLLPQALPRHPRVVQARRHGLLLAGGVGR